ncbi:MAG: leucyl aminopeptidase [Candidatus Neomarinimicrobiota bacterium]
MANLDKIKHSSADWRKIKRDVIAVGIYDDLRPTRQFQQVNQVLGRALSNALKAKMITGKKGEIVDLAGKKGLRAFVVSLGTRKQLSLEVFRQAGAAVSKMALGKKLGNITFLVPLEARSPEFSQALAEGLMLGSYQYLEHKTESEDDEKKHFMLKSATLVGGRKSSVEKGSVFARSVCLARDISNRPANVATPSHLAQQAAIIGKKGNLKVTVFDRREFTDMGMGALAGVAQGSDEPPKFIILEYQGGEKDRKPIILVGKGLTFDSGGISLKPPANMDQMKFDMCGSSIVLGVMNAVAVLKPKINVVGIIPATENLNGGKAFKPGDILKAYNGKTIEILNTDAEGRLILADALAYACKHYDPAFIVDFATLTGAVLITLGNIATAVLGNNKKLMKKVKASAENTGEKVWELPLWDEYCKQVESKIADVKNMGSGRMAGTIAGAAFLKEFVDENIPWVHFDIAGTAWGERDLPYFNKGQATGVVIRLVLDLLKV